MTISEVVTLGLACSACAAVLKRYLVECVTLWEDIDYTSVWNVVIHYILMYCQCSSIAGDVVVEGGGGCKRVKLHCQCWFSTRVSSWRADNQW